MSRFVLDGTHADGAVRILDAEGRELAIVHRLGDAQLQRHVTNAIADGLERAMVPLPRDKPGKAR